MVVSLPMNVKLVVRRRRVSTLISILVGIYCGTVISWSRIGLRRGLFVSKSEGVARICLPRSLGKVKTFTRCADANLATVRAALYHTNLISGAPICTFYIQITRSSAQGNCSAKSLAASVMSSILPCSSILPGPPCSPPVILSGGGGVWLYGGSGCRGGP